MDTSAPRSAIDACAASQQALEAMLVGLTDAQASAPSLLPNWTVGHVLTHIARNADGVARLMEGAERGEVAEMYPGGFAGREADIQTGAARPAAELVDDIVASGQRLGAAFATASPRAWQGSGMTLKGPTRIVDVPEWRRGEVEIHRVDLGLGYTFADQPADFVRAELVKMTRLWASRKPMGFTDLPTPALALSPPDRLAWLTGRLEVDGVAPAGIF